jgi:hypothetical protein
LPLIAWPSRRLLRLYGGGPAFQPELRYAIHVDHELPGTLVAGPNTAVRVSFSFSGQWIGIFINLK